MEVSVLSEQVDAQSNKIQELENLLQDKKDTLRQMEEALQKVEYLVILYLDRFRFHVLLIRFIGSSIKKCFRDTEVGASYLFIRNETQTS